MKADYIDHMGSDLDVVNAARVSFHKESEYVPAFVSDDGKNTFVVPDVLSEADQKLIAYLARHKHWSPFAHCFAKFRIKAPIFVARQLVKHQIGFAWNEVSRRYVDDTPEFFSPDQWRSRPDASIKQGSGSVCDEDTSGFCSSVHSQLIDRAISTYETLLEEGVAPEQARMVLPQSMYTEWIWSGSLMAWARMCQLRLDPHAQAETAVIADQVGQKMSELFPVSWKELMQ